jgi:hypothetical protein
MLFLNTVERNRHPQTKKYRIDAYLKKTAKATNSTTYKKEKECFESS